MGPLDPKDALLSRIRAALRKGGERLSTGGAEAAAGAAGPRERLETFRSNLAAAGGMFLSAPSPHALLPALSEALRMEGVTALVFPGEDEAAGSLAEALVPMGPFRLASGADVLVPAPPVVAGIQSAEYAVAESGSVVQTSRGGRTLLPGLATDVHVAVLSPGSLVDRLDDVLVVFAQAPPRNISIITGPSRTGDIEQTLTVGAHGPRRLIVVQAG